MTTSEQKQLLTYTKAKVRALFKEHPAPAHEYDHADRVRKHGVVIAKAEKEQVWLAELIALLHDIGRTKEHFEPKQTHHEWSYSMCQEWFREDFHFDVLSDEEKLCILYSVRNHWNSCADDYKQAIILRDADKLDGLGSVGLRRIKMYNKGNELDQVNDMRLHYEMLYWLRTKKAQAIAKQFGGMTPIDREYARLLKKGIKKVSL